MRFPGFWKLHQPMGRHGLLPAGTAIRFSAVPGPQQVARSTPELKAAFERGFEEILAAGGGGAGKRPSSNEGSVFE
jgi:hypothetical protein